MKLDTSSNIQQFYFNTTNDCDLNQTSIIQKDPIQHADCDYNVAVNVSSVFHQYESYNVYTSLNFSRSKTFNFNGFYLLHNLRHFYC